MREKMNEALRAAAQYAFAAVRLLPAAALIGLLGGVVGAAFHHGIRLAAVISALFGTRAAAT